MKNVLITGGAGFIGSNFVRYLLQAEPSIQIVNLDALTYAGSLENIKDLPDSQRHQFIQGDICDRSLVEDIFHRYTIDTLVHFAAESHVDRSILSPEQFVKTNVMGTFTLLDVARRVWIDEKIVPLEEVRFHHVSTDEVFGSLEKDDPPFNENTPYAPNSPYAASKAASDYLVRAYSQTYGLPVTVTNCSNNYGPFQFPEKLIPLMILNGITGRAMPIYGDGMQIRDWLFVEDHCEAIYMVLRKGRLGETYNVGGNNQPANMTIVSTLCNILDAYLPTSTHVPHKNLMMHVADRPGHDRRYAMDISKIQKELGWQPRHTLESGLRLTVEWYLSHLEWVQAIQKQQEYQKWLEQNYKLRGEAG